MSKNLATLLGFSAILLWSSLVGLLKKLSSLLGADYAVTLMYSLSTVILLIIFKIPNLKIIPKIYLIGASLLFLVYELCFSYAIALAQTSQQAIEISLVNYLWPSLTVAMLIIFKELKFSIFVIFGLMISMCGIVVIQTGNNQFSLITLWTHFMSNPISYILALMGAILWATYCVITRKYSQGHNPIALYFVLISVVLWTKLLMTHSIDTLPNIDFEVLPYLIAVGLATALGYAAWNIGIIKGNITFLVTLSYFSPIFSTLFSMLILQTVLSLEFWHGVYLVTLGSLVCWLSTSWEQIKPRIQKIKLQF
ncbi:drug/metabolite DMT transporter permease [Acinetobacter defluvii]|uniref:Drug/metabolite DMT transporter permease n=1 Tax=Acinetobacter defluvii TaxID=1871111 RepID=A0A2S2FCJ9_9GAMM|nr:aromatic amino acid DMT transporter YddG [Acinetobacter defluvii]AWL28707.1 drug/metabolite DMT transporter permease [Acinetobacter defluvii]